MRVCGPILYLNEWTLDGRLLVKHDKLTAWREPIFVVTRADTTDLPHIVGVVDELDVHCNALWAIGELYQAPEEWADWPRIYVTTSIIGGVTGDVNFEGTKIVTEGDWRPITIVAHGVAPIPELWKGKQTWLEEE